MQAEPSVSSFHHFLNSSTVSNIHPPSRVGRQPGSQPRTRPYPGSQGRFREREEAEGIGTETERKNK